MRNSTNQLHVFRLKKVQMQIREGKKKKITNVIMEIQLNSTTKLRLVPLIELNLLRQSYAQLQELLDKCPLCEWSQGIVRIH